MDALTRETLLAGARSLRASDARLGAWIDRIGPVGLRRQRHRFGALCRAIISQQLGAGAARSIHRRFLKLFAPARSPDPAALLRIHGRRLRSCGLSTRKVEYLRGLGEAFVSGDLSRLKLSRLGDEEVIEALTRLRGVGRWTAEMFLIFSLGRLDVFSAGDLALVTAAGRVEGRSLSPKAAARVAERWSPYRSVASLYLWKVAHWRGEET